MHPDVFRDIFEHHWLDVLDAVVEKVTLSLDDRFDNPINRLSPVLDVAEQIDG